MQIYLVRHAKAERRTQHDDVLRPLSTAGHAQTMELVERFREVAIARVISSPALRCRQTVEPLATRLGLPVEIDERLAEGGALAGALALIRSLEALPAVLCAHGDLIPAIVERLAPGTLVLEGEIACPKGSTWVFHGAAGARPRAAFLPPPPREPRGACRRLAVADLGSTSFHLLVADVFENGHIERVARERELLRLGAALAQDDKIGDEVAERAVETAKKLGRLAEREGAEEIVAVATSAMRDAKNGKKLAERLGRALGSEVHVLSGEEEARLIFAAFRRRVGLGPDTALGLDLGGGSLELAAGNADELFIEATLRLGVARLHGQLAPSDPIAPSEARALRERVDDALEEVRGKLRALRPTRCIAAGGTVRGLARLLLGETGAPATTNERGLLVTREELESLTRRLAKSHQAERLALPGVDPRRADLLPAGAIILIQVLARLGLPGFMVCDWGLREGALLQRTSELEGVARRRGEVFIRS